MSVGNLSAGDQASAVLATLRWPLQASVLGATVILVLAESAMLLIWGFTSLVTLGRGGFLGLIVVILIGILTTVLLVQYSSVAFVASAMGDRSVRVLDASDLLPFSTPVTGRLVFLTLLLVAVVVPAIMRANPTLSIAAFVLLAFLLPGMLTLLAVNKSLSMALDPRNLFSIVASMGPTYLLMPLVCVAALAAIVALRSGEWPWLVRSLGTAYVYFLALHVLGRIVYACRERLGLEVNRAPELEDAAEQAEQLRQHAAMLEQAYPVSRTSVADTLKIIDKYLQGENDTIEVREWVFGRLQDWADKATAVWFANDLVTRQLRRGLADDALRTTVWCLDQNPAFRPRGADATFELAQLAVRNGRNRLATALLSDFADRFGNNPHTVPSLLLCARLALEKTNQRELAIEAITRLERDSRHKLDPRVIALRKLAEAGP